MSDIATVRRKIGDRPKAQNDILEGNGVDRVIDLQHGNVWDVIVRVGEAELPNTEYTIDSQPGRITFTTPPEQAASVRISYLYAAYTDDELTELLTSEGGVTGAVIACLEELTMETARFYDFTQGETSEKRSQVFKNLVELLNSYKTQKANEDATAKRGSGLTIGKRTVGPADRRTRFPRPGYSPSRRV